MSQLFDCAEEQSRTAGIQAAVTAVRGGELVVLPTDTVYGIGADAFTPHAVASLLAAKKRGRDMPVPVLVGTAETIDGLAASVPPVARELIAAFWPGGLTLIVNQVPSLAWDLGEAAGTVAVRMPDDTIALEVLRETGPMAVSSANISGSPPARTAAQAADQFQGFVSVYLEAGPSPVDAVASTIVDVTDARPRLLRPGAISAAELRTVATQLVEL